MQEYLLSDIGQLLDSLIIIWKKWVKWLINCLIDCFIDWLVIELLID